jgi:4,5:9,10-diseco-3-hydroxy-5,9,17-trioxoandrosta-1(10),2-diene-4-oate hydrolase
VDKLILMAPGGLEDRDVYMGMRGIRRMIKAFFSPEGITRDSMRRVFELQLFDSSLVTDQIIEERFQIAELQPKAVMATSRVPNLADRLSELTQPVFAWWGLEDQFCPVSGADRILRSVEGARVMSLAQCGHWVMVEHRDVFNRLTLDFLQEA